MAADLDLFHCERRTMKLTKSACSKLWLSAQAKRPDPWEGRAACLTCAVGRRNSGVAADPHAEIREQLRMVCPRCLRSAGRLINGHLCVSCYNRDREARIGRNRKGTKPRLCDVLHGRSLTVIRGSEVTTVRVERVTSLVEAIITLSKRERGPVAFAPTLVRWPGAEPCVWVADRTGLDRS